jgi:crotonobetainyl-CoA:carnitine CoA-transferase CaiB-like acyl-CoA transferase
VLLENSRPGAMQRLGLGWDWFGPRKPATGVLLDLGLRPGRPARTEGGFDLTMQAAAGVMSVTGEPDGAPVKAGVPLADFASGLYAAYSIASLIARVRAGGAGGHIDVPMFAATLAISALQTSEYFGTGRNPVKLGSAHPRNAPYQAYRRPTAGSPSPPATTSCGRAVCDVVGTPELLADRATPRPRCAPGTSAS